MRKSNIKSSALVRWVISVFLLLFAVTVEAEVYRCVDATGGVIFTQKPCAPHEEGEKINLDGFNTAKKPNPHVCHEIKNLAEVIFPHIAKTDSVLDVYSNLGGREYLSAGVTAAVNYVFNFRYNPKAKQDEVVELTYAKCLDGGFGQITERELPDWGSIKYSKEKSKGNEPGKAQNAQPSKACQQYDEKIKVLKEKMASAKTKSEKLQAQVDTEYYEGLKKDQCNGDHDATAEKDQAKK